MTASNQTPGELDERDRELLARARKLAALPASAVREYAGDDDSNMARAVVLGEAQYLLAELAAITARLAGGEK